MLSNYGSILPEFIGAIILGILTYALSFLFPAMDDNLRWAIAGAVAFVGWVVWRHVIGQSFKRFTHWLARICVTLLNRARAMFESVKARSKRFRACLRGELEQCRSELKTERMKYNEERTKVEKLTLALATLSQHILSLCDQRMEKPNELEWGGALAACERAVRCARAAQYHHVTKIVYYDPSYPASWMKGENAEKTRDYFVDRWFVEKNAQQLKDWINIVLKNGSAYKSLIVFAQDIVPETVAEVPNETCLLRKYLDAGGRVVWRGDIPFWRQGKASEALEYWDSDGPLGILGVFYHNFHFRWNPPKEGDGRVWDSDLPSEVTPMGRDIGLAYSGKCTRPVPCQDVDVTYVLIRQETFTVMDATIHGSGDDLALCWKKNFNKRYPHSGFMQYVPGEFLWRETNTSYFNFAVSGWPLVFE